MLSDKTKPAQPLKVAPAEPVWSKSVNEAGARRLFQRRGERAVFFAAGAGQRGNPVQVILRGFAVALFNLPKPVILPGLDVVGIGL